MKAWSIKSEPIIGITRTGSGSPKDDVFKIRMYWSKKLGLELKHRFDSKDAALRTLTQIKEATYITIDFWDRTFYPSGRPEEWVSQSFAD